MVEITTPCTNSSNQTSTNPVCVLMLKFVNVFQNVLFLSPLEQINWAANRTVNSLCTTVVSSSSNPVLPIAQWIETITNNQYEKLCILGRGAFATVYLCRNRHTKELCAVKVLNKAQIRDMGQIDRSLAERRILTHHHPFITKLHHAFQTPTILCFVLEYCAGGDLFTLLDRRIRLNENLGMFYAGSIVLALQHLHQQNIAYRDLKPENVLIDHTGYIRLTDFGLAKENMTESTKTKSMCGSADYIAPEVLSSCGYTKSSDLWSLGCIVFELLTGFPPFYSGKNRSQVNSTHRLGKVVYPTYLSQNACSFIAGLLKVNPSERLGNGPKGYLDIFEHPFFQTLDWYSLVTKKMRAPHIPQIQFQGDTGHFCKEFTTIQVSGSFVPEEITLEENEFKEFDWTCNNN